MADTGRLQNTLLEFQELPGSSTAILEMRLAGIRPTHKSKILLEWIRTEFNLPVSMAKECSEYFLRVWNGKFVVDSIVEGKLSFWGMEQPYMVHWQSTPAVCKEAAAVACSFRTYKGVNYVIIKVWKGEE